MAQVQEEMRRTYVAQRGVSQGASLTLTSHVGGYQARFECATKAADILGNRNLGDYGMPGESIPVLHIPTEDLHRSITKLAEKHSVALVDTVTDEAGTRFVLVWRIVPTTKAVAQPEEINLDEY